MRSQALYLGAVGAQALASAALLPVLTHNLSRQQYGMVALVVVYQQAVTVVVGLGVPSLITSWVSGGKYPELERGSARPMLLTGSLAIVGAVLSTSMLLMTAAILGTMNAIVTLVLCRVAGQGKAAIWAIVTVAAGPFVAAVSAATMLLTRSLTGYFLAWTMSLAAITLASLYWGRMEWFRVVPKRLVLRRLRFSAPIMMAAVAASALSSGDRLIIGMLMGPEDLAPYQAAYSVGNLAPLAGAAITNHWVAGLMRGERSSELSQLAAVSGIGVAGALASGPLLVVLLPASYDPITLWPIAAIAAISAVPLGLYLRAQARTTYVGATRPLGVVALSGTVIAMAVTVAITLSTGSYLLIALVTPLAYASLAAYLGRVIARGA